MFCLMCAGVTFWCVLMCMVYLLNDVCFLSLGVVCFVSGCVWCCDFCLICDAYGSCYGFACGEYRFLMFAPLGSVLDALDAVLSMCLLYVSLGSRVRPSIFFGGVFMSIVLFLICGFSLVLYSAGSDVKRVHVFSVFRMRLVACVHTWMLL